MISLCLKIHLLILLICYGKILRCIFSKLNCTWITFPHMPVICWLTCHFKFSRESKGARQKMIGTQSSDTISNTIPQCMWVTCTFFARPTCVNGCVQYFVRIIVFLSSQRNFTRISPIL